MSVIIHTHLPFDENQLSDTQVQEGAYRITINGVPHIIVNHKDPSFDANGFGGIFAQIIESKKIPKLLYYMHYIEDSKDVLFLEQFFASTYEVLSWTIFQ